MTRARRTQITRWLLVAAAALLASGCNEASSPASADTKAGAPPEARLRVRVEPVRLGQLESAGSVTGTVRAFHKATVTAEAQGRVLKRNTEPGAKVEAGDVLVELEASRARLELARATASREAARTVLTHAERELERGKALRAKGAISVQRLDDLQHGLDRARDELALAKVNRDTARRNLADTRIVAPFAGSVDSLAVNVGDFVAPGTPVATVVDFSKVRIFAGVTAVDAARLEPGSSAEVSFADLGGDNFTASLQSVARVADPADGTYEVELWMDDATERMRDGLVARIAFPNSNGEASLLTRRAALLRSGGVPKVFVVEGGPERSVARARTIRTGRSAGDWIEVLDGLAEGERVIFDGQFALEDGSVVQIDGAKNAVAAGQPE